MGRGEGEWEMGEEQVKRLMILESVHLRGWSRCQPLSFLPSSFHPSSPINSHLDLSFTLIDWLLLLVDKRITRVRPLELTFVLSLFLFPFT